jgi:hypothetical protein
MPAKTPGFDLVKVINHLTYKIVEVISTPGVVRTKWDDVSQVCGTVLAHSKESGHVYEHQITTMPVPINTLSMLSQKCSSLPPMLIYRKHLRQAPETWSKDTF